MDRVRVIVVASFVLVSAACPARAEEPGKPQRARALFDKGQVQFSLGDFSSALDLFRRAYEAKPLAGFLFNIGQCQRKLGDCTAARFSYQQYLMRVPNAKNRALVEAVVHACTEAPKSQTRPPDAAAPLSADAARAPDLDAAVAPAPPAASTSATRPGAALSAPDAALSASPGSPSSGRLRTALLWSGVAVSVTLTAVGVTAGALALAKSRRYKDPATTLDERLELADSGAALSTTANVALPIGAAVAVATGLYFWLGRPAGRRPAVAVHAMPGGATVGLKGLWP